ncbi:hypothetical protein ABH968_002276 [Lysinibacillus sp. RC79]
MSKRKRTSKIDKWIKEGRGTGSGADYQPWLKIQDVSSLGRSTRLVLKFILFFEYIPV